MKPNGTVDLGLAMEHLLTGKPGTEREEMRKKIENCDVKGKIITNILQFNIWMIYRTY